MISRDSAQGRSLRRWGLGWGAALACGLLSVGLVVPALAQDRDGERKVARGAEGESKTFEEEVGEPESGGEGDLDQGEEEVVEGDPESREPVWRLNTRLGNRAKLEFPTAQRESPRVTIEHAQTGVAWHIRLGLGPFPIESEKAYMLQFKARSDFPRDFSVGFSQLHRPYKALSSVVQLEATPLWSNYRVRLISEDGDEISALMFNLGGNRYSMEISDVSIVRGSDREVVAQGPQGPVQPRPEGAPEPNEPSGPTEASRAGEEGD